jgi:hypothetical protein
MEIHPRRLGVFLPFFGLAIMAGCYPALIFPQAAPVPAKLTYSRVFKGSNPEYLRLTVDSKGSGTFEGHKIDEAQRPRSFQLSAATTEHLFNLAAQLDNFHSLSLESHKKVANLGQKTLTYEQGEDVNRVAFNFTENRSARELVDIFEAMGAVEEHISALEFEMKYDPLGLSQELSQIQSELDNKSLTDPQILIPTLETIARSSRFLHLAQVRAQQIIERIQPNP